jgi:serine/threonine-protein kinase
VTCPPEWRGKPVALVIPYFEGAVTLRANGVEVPALEGGLWPGTPSLTTHRFRLDEGVTASAGMDLELDFDRSWTRAGWVDTVPRLTLDLSGDVAYRAVSFVDGSVAVASFAVISMIGFIYFVLYFQDRRRKTHLWFAVITVGAAIQVLYDLGVAEVLVGPYFVATLSTPVTLIVSINFVTAYFGIAPPGIVWRVCAAVSLVASLLAMGPFGAETFANQLVVPLIVVLLGYWVAWLAIALRRGRDRFAATTLLIGSVLVALAALPDIVYYGGLGQIIGGAMFIPAGMAAYGVMQAILLGRDHVRSLREADARVAMLEERDRENRRLNDELRRQIADRSARLAEALARIGAVPARATALASGTVVHGRYRVIAPLGEGAMGAVFEVERTTDGRRLAMKVLTSATHGAALARLAREAQIAAQVMHENLVATTDVDVSEDGALYIVMELVDGASLQDACDRFGDVAWARIVLRQVAHGLAALHARGVVHRDLKPANVLLTKSGVAKIADFGIARLGGDTGEPVAAIEHVDPGLTRTLGADPALAATGAAAASPVVALTATGVLMGTPLYMAPELARGTRAALPSCDVWAFGVLAHEVLTGKSPFVRVPVLDALAGREPPVAPSLTVDGLSAETVRVVERCLARDPALRPAASELARVLA